MGQMHAADFQAFLLGDGVAEKNAAFGLNRRLKGEIFDDFHSYTDTQMFTMATGADAAAGTAAASDAHGGVLVMTPAGADDNYVVVASTKELILPVLGKKLFFQARIKHTEANTDDANLFVGLSDDGSATALGAAGAGPSASYDGIGFHKVDGGTTWIVECSNAAVQTTYGTGETAPTRSSGVWTDLAFAITDWSDDGTKAYVDFYVDGLCVAYHVELTLSGLAEMQVVLAVKNGGANAEVLYVDFVQVVFER